MKHYRNWYEEKSSGAEKASSALIVKMGESQVCSSLKEF